MRDWPPWQLQKPGQGWCDGSCEDSCKRVLGAEIAGRLCQQRERRREAHSAISSALHQRTIRHSHGGQMVVGRIARPLLPTKVAPDAAAMKNDQLLSQISEFCQEN